MFSSSITNINTDCRELIFEHLEFNDLVNIADTSKQFYSTVCLVYKRKYVNMNPMFIDIMSSSSFEDPDLDTDALERNPKIFIKNPIILLKLLRNFGHSIRNLGVDFSLLNTKIRAGIENYLAEYCHESLQRFTFICNDKLLFEHLQNPFKNLTALKIQTKLEEKQNNIQFINENNLPNLQYLYISSYCIDQQEKIHHKNVEQLTIQCRRLNTFPFSFKNLMNFTLYGETEINDKFCGYIGRVKHLKTLRLMSFGILWSSESLSKLSKLQNISSNLEELQIAFDEITTKTMFIDATFQFMKQCRNLRKMSFSLHSELKGHVESWLLELLLKLSDEWKSYIIDPHMCGSTSEFKCYVIEKKNQLIEE